MNPIAEEMMSYYGIIELDEESLEHYGMPRRSGRYPWGSGEDPYQRTGDLIGRIEELKKNGWTETPENIMSEFGLTTSQYRAQKAISKNERRALQVATAKSLKEDGLGATEIGRKMGLPESTVRSLLDENSEARMNQAMKTADFLREQINTKGMIDVGAGVERELNISREKMKQALDILEAEGYVVYGGGVPQVTNKGQQTNIKVICPPGTEHKEIYNYENVHTITDYTSHDGGETFDTFQYPRSMDSKRLMIRYKEDGGIDKDGIIELRRGVDDISLGESHYAQVRILVDNTHYLKGMALYSDDMPDGVDVIFNTNKTKDVPALGDKTSTVLKNIKDDPENPFGSAIKEKGGQSYYDDPNGTHIDPITGKRQSLSLINKRADEGDWTEWKDKLPAQFLSKQSLSMAKKQLGLAITDKQDEYNEISSLTNPTVKKYLLNKFADECDSAAVHLQAAALPGQKYHVIIPITSMKDNEVYAPKYDDGTKLALIRYPHGGTFEIPILTVNNKQPLAKKLLGPDVDDAVGINSKVAERLSGADFDGDTVMCIPTHDKNGRVKITSTPPLKGLEGFDPKTEYGGVAKKGEDGKDHYYRNGVEYRIMKNTQNEMGRISNLITDMTLQGATDDEKARAVRHSMVVIDAEKHKLDYKQSEIDNNIAALKKTYQPKGGASTLISRSKGEYTVDKREGSPTVNMKLKKNGDINPDYDPSKPEGSLIWKTASDKKLYYDEYKVNKKTGEVTVVTKKRTQKSSNMAETDDARTLISEADTPMERAYADYANKMKSLANSARKQSMTTGKISYDAQAKKTYQKEVDELTSRLNTALLNAPKERHAQLKANYEVTKSKNAIKEKLRNKYPDATNTELNKLVKKEFDEKKAGQKALSKYRKESGSVARRDRSIKITDREWEAIQAGAVSETVLKKILENTDVDTLRERATPRSTKTLTTSKISRIKAMQESNYTIAEIAKKMGVSTSTVSEALKS